MLGHVQHPCLSMKRVVCDSLQLLYKRILLHGGFCDLQHGFFIMASWSQLRLMDSFKDYCERKFVNALRMALMPKKDLIIDGS